MSLGSIGGISSRGASRAARGVAAPRVPAMAPMTTPISGQTGYGGVAQLGVNKSIHHRNVAGMSPGAGGYAGAAARAARNSPVANSIRTQQRPQRLAKINAARAQSAMNKRTGVAAPAPAGRGMSMKTKIGLGIAGGIAAGTVMNRSGSGTDRGRTSVYRY